MRNCSMFPCMTFPCISVNTGLHSGIELICFLFASGCKLQAAQFSYPVFATWSPPALTLPSPSPVNHIWEPGGLAGSVWSDSGACSLNAPATCNQWGWGKWRLWGHIKKRGGNCAFRKQLNAPQLWTPYFWLLASKNNHSNGSYCS